MRYQPQGRVKIGQGFLASRLVAGVCASQYTSAASGRPITLAANQRRVVSSQGIAFQATSAGQGSVDFGAGGLDSLIPIGGSFSIYARVFISTLGQRQAITSDHNSSGGGDSVLIEVTAANEWRFNVNAPSAVNLLVPGATLGWHDVLAVHIAGTGNLLYVDGQLIGQNSFTTQLRFGSNFRCCALGAYAVTGAFRGLLTAFYVFREDVSAARFELLANPWCVYESPEEEYEIAAAASGYMLTASPGSFTLSGSAASLKASRKFAASPGAFALAGTAAGLRASRRLTAATGALALTGENAALIASRRLPVATGSFALGGSEASLRVARRLAASAGAFTLISNSASLTYSPAVAARVLIAQTGMFSLTGGAAILRVTRRLAADAGSFVVTGNAAALRCERRITAASGVVVLTGGDAILRATRRMTAEVGSFTLTGTDVLLRYSGQIEYARAPSGAGFTPKRIESATRPAQVGAVRPEAIQRNTR